MGLFGKSKQPDLESSGLPKTGAAIEQESQAVAVVSSEKDKVAEAAKKEANGEKGSEKEKPQPGIGNYFRVFTYGDTLDFALMGTSCLTSIGSGATMPLMNIVFGQLVGNFTNYFMDDTATTRDEFQAEINKLALYITYLFIAKFCLSYISMLTVRIGGLRISANLRLAYLRATFAQPVSVIDTVSPGKVSTRITTSSNTIQLGISQQFAMVFQALAFTIGMYVVSFVKAWLLTFVASASLPFILIVYGSLIGPFMKIHKGTEKIHEEASALAYEIFSSVRIVVAFGAKEKLLKQHEDLLDKAAANSNRLTYLMGVMMSPSFVAMYGTFGLTFWFGIKQYSEGNISDMGDIVIVLFSVMMAVMYIGRLVGPLIAIGKAATAATELFATIDAEKPDTSGLKEPEISSNGDITFENVAFSYPSRPDVQILEGLDLNFEAGKVTAIVGPSGSGKSTVVGLVQRWYNLLQTTAIEKSTDKPENSSPVDQLSTDNSEEKTKKKEKKAKKSKKGKDNEKDDKKDEEIDIGRNTCTGAVRIGKTDLRDVDLKWWRSQIGLVQQEPFLFNDTLFNNVAFGLCGTPWQDAPDEDKLKMVKEACKEAYAEEFIDKLPKGYDTFVGESGIKLSGGQRQRVAIARSIVKHPPILILDEATSAIDVRTERIVQEALDNISQHRTTIVIAHRLSTIKRADKIVVMRKGQLAEQGSHEELLKKEGGVYSGLVRSQELTMESQEQELEEESLEKTKTAETEKSEANDREERLSIADPEYKDKGLIMGFGRLIAEQRHHWVLYTIAVFGILGAGAVYPLQAWIFAQVVATFTYTDERLVEEGNFWSGMFGVEAAGVGIAYFILGAASFRIAVAITRYYRQEYITNMMQKRIPFFDTEGHSPGSLTSRVSSDTEQLQQLMSVEMSYALIAVVNLVGSIIIAFVYGWKLSLVGLFAALPPILFAGYFRFAYELKFEKMNAAVFEDSSQFATEAVGAFRTVLSLIMEDFIGDKYQTLLKGHVSKAFGSAKFGTIVYAASDSIELACMALTFWYGGTLLASREYFVDEFFVIYMAIIQGAVAAGMWFSFAPNMAQAAGAANRILSMRTPPNTAAPKYEPLKESPNGVGIEFRNVHFAYKSREVPVLSNFSIEIQPGQFAALVGASGCGKSTTISLLERFYDPTSGNILYNGQDITALNPEEYRKQIALVSQEPTLYEGTIRDNVALSVASATDPAIETACRAAQIHTFIASLPQAYNTRLGPKGMSLSGGQKQRLSLARALLRHPKLLLLDEATSSLDSESEALVQDAIERAAGEGKRTVIAVAHRLATIQKAHVIFVLGSGEVLEKGGHAELLRRRGVYWQMCRAQALDR